MDDANQEYDDDDKEYMESDEDTWVEACRLTSDFEAKAVIASRGDVKSIPNSAKLWAQAAMLEQDNANKSRILMKGLEYIPDSLILWKALVELASNEEDARLLLHRALECCPSHVELWLALARLEKTHENATNVLLKAATEKLSKEPSIWIAAAMLEEEAYNGNNTGNMVGEIIDRGIRALQGQGLEIDRKTWIKEAEAAERAGSIATCRAIIQYTIGVGVQGDDRKRTWPADAKECMDRGSIETARAIYAHAITFFPNKRLLLIDAAELEIWHGTKASLDALKSNARKARRALKCSTPRAHQHQRANAAIPNPEEEIWLAKFNPEFVNNEPARARMLLAEARERGGGGTERVWVKSATVERQLGNTAEEWRILDQGLELFPTFSELWLMRGHMEEQRLNNPNRAKETFELGLKHCSSCIPLWLSLARLEEGLCGLGRARAVLAMAREKNPRTPRLWLAAVRAEARHGYRQESDHLMAEALKECPTSGLLQAASIEMAPPRMENRRINEAFTACGRNPHVVVAKAKVYWRCGRVDAARRWFKQAVTRCRVNGDFWAFYYKFELQHGTDQLQKDILNRCVTAEPKHGEKWLAVSKAVENFGQPIEVILNKVVVAMGEEQV